MSQDDQLIDKDGAYRKAFELTAYLEKVNLAQAYPGDCVGEAWNSLFLMGLALQGLTLIPVTYSVEVPWFVVQAPSPHLPSDLESHTEAWEPSWIVPEGFI